MYKISDISVVLPSYNNIEYLKLAYKSIREISKDIELILCDDCSDDGTKEWLLSLNEKNNIIKIFDKKVGHPYLYDMGFNITNKKIIGIFHADMIAHKEFFNNILKYLNKNHIICGTCVEPPMHNPGNEKYILDAGFYPNDFNNIKFENFFEGLKKGETSTGIFAPWFLLKEDYINIIGKHDPLFDWGEDTDLFNRMVLANFNIIQSRDALVYHFTQRGHKFKNGVIGDIQSDYSYRVYKDTRNFIRKWGNLYKFDINHRPIPLTKYNIGFEITKCNYKLLEILEPWCSDILIDDEMQVLTTHYLDREQKNTSFNLSKKIKTTPFQTLENEIIIRMNGNTFNNEDFQIIQTLSDIIKDSGEIGKFQIGNLIVEIKAMNEYQNSLIKL